MLYHWHNSNRLFNEIKSFYFPPKIEVGADLFGGQLNVSFNVKQPT